MDIEYIKNKIASNDGVMLYFSTNSCNVCQALKPKIIDAFDKNFPKIEKIFIDTKEYPQIASEYTVFAIPTIIVFLDGKEFAKKSRNLSVDMFVDEIKRPYEIMLG
jgi:thioredoxin 1